GAAGERRHDAHAFEDRLAADNAVGLPQRVDAALFAQIDPPPEAAGPAERKLHQAEPDGDIPRHAIPREGCAPAAARQSAAPMNGPDRPPDDATPAPPGATRSATAGYSGRLVQVWDLPTRLFHWLAAALVAAAYLTWRLNWMDWHGWAGEAVLALVLWRL